MTYEEWLKGRGTANPLIAEWKDQSSGDAWGDAMSFGFAACDWAQFHGYAHLIPEALGYSPSPFGPDTENYTYQEIDALAAGDSLVFPSIGEAAIVAALPTALKALVHYLELCKLEGLDY